MILPTHQLEAFVAVARTRHFTRAAQSVHLTQSALSQRIQALEESLGTALLIRDRAGARLTETGEKLLRYCQAQDGLEAELLADLRADRTGGVVRIGAFSSIARSLVLPALGRLAARRPELRIEVLVRELAELPDLLRRAEADYVLTAENLGRDDTESLHLGDESNVLVRAPGAPDNDAWFLDHHEQDEVTLRYLRKHRTAREARQAAGRRRYLDEVYGLLDGVRLGLGSAVLPIHLVEGQPGIQIVHPKQTLETPVWLHHWQQPFYSRLHGEVLGALRTEARHLLRS